MDKEFGILATPDRGIPLGVKNGMVWAADNQVFTKAFNPDIFFPWLEKLSPYKSTCLFISVPDVIGNARATHLNWKRWRSSFMGWPVAYVAQDGQESEDFPILGWDCLFVGGTTEWKMSQAAIECIHRAQALGKHIHIGRVNYWKRYRHFMRLRDSSQFTCDGTRVRFERTKAIEMWRTYMHSNIGARLK